jgi:hypothetical protein
MSRQVRRKLSSNVTLMAAAMASPAGTVPAVAKTDQHCAQDFSTRVLVLQLAAEIVNAMFIRRRKKGRENRPISCQFETYGCDATPRNRQKFFASFFQKRSAFSFGHLEKYPSPTRVQ